MSGAGLLIAVIITIYVTHLVTRERSRRRIARWSKDRVVMGDDEFFSFLEPGTVTKNAAVTMRTLIASAVRIPAGLIRPDDSVRELEAIGDPSHRTVIDYLVDISSVKEPGDEAALVSVRGLVLEFGPQLAGSSESRPRL